MKYESSIKCLNIFTNINFFYTIQNYPGKAINFKLYKSVLKFLQHLVKTYVGIIYVEKFCLHRPKDNRKESLITVVLITYRRYLITEIYNNTFNIYITFFIFIYYL